MTLRIAFDLDGVLADMGSALRREERRLFRALPQADEEVRESEQESPEIDETEAETDLVVAETPERGLTARERRLLWRNVANIENFWETLDEIEPGAVRCLAQIAASRRWEVIFLTKRPATAGATSQVQTQRWLQRHGFPLPSVFVVNGSRGKIADALGLDIIVDDLPVNCIDVLSDSKAKAILICRGSSDTVPAAVRRLGIGVIASVMECLEILTAVDDHRQRPKMMDRVKWALRLTGHK